MPPIPPSPVPGRVLLFSGHMVDAPSRPQPRFPPAAVAQAAQDIGRVLDALNAGPGDIGLTQGASGGDLLFAEACQQRGVALRLLQAVTGPRFTQESLLASADGEHWRQRHLAVRARLAAPPEVLPEAATPQGPDRGVYVRCNLWLLDRAMALAHGHPTRPLHLICLWDGGGGDGLGGTAHMVQEVQRRHGQVHRLTPRL